MPLSSSKEDGTPWWVTARNWHAAGVVLSRDFPYLGVTQPIACTGIIPSMASADDGYSSQLGRNEVLGLGLKVVSIGGAKGKKITEAQQWNSPPYRQARAERSAIESLLFTLKEGFEFGALARRTHENVLAEMLEKVLAYNICQISRLRKKLSELEQIHQAAA